MRDWRNKLRKTGGFTLVEMLIVVAIIAILVAVSIPLVSNSLENARDNTDRANERAAKAEAAMVQLGVVDVPGWNHTDPLYYDAEAGELVTKDKLGDITPYGKCSQEHGADQFADKADGPHDEDHGIIEVTFLEDGVIFLTWVNTDGSGGVDPETGNRNPGSGDNTGSGGTGEGPTGGTGTGCTCNGSEGVCNCGEPPCSTEGCVCTSCKAARDTERNRLWQDWYDNKLTDKNKKDFVDEELLDKNDTEKMEKVKDWLEEAADGSTIDWDALGYKEPDPECNCSDGACTCTESCECGDCKCSGCPGECPEEPGPECKCNNDVCICGGVCGCYGDECRCGDCDGSIAAEAERQRKRQELYDKWCEEQGATNDNPRKKEVAENNKDQIMDDLEKGENKTIYDYGYSDCTCETPGASCGKCGCGGTGNCSCEGCGGNTSGGGTEQTVFEKFIEGQKQDNTPFWRWYNNLSKATQQWGDVKDAIEKLTDESTLSGFAQAYNNAYNTGTPSNTVTEVEAISIVSNWSLAVMGKANDGTLRASLIQVSA